MITAIVLAAGTSQRMGTQNKLLLPWGDSTIVATVVDTVVSAGPDETIVVIGPEAATMKKVLGNRPIRFVVNERFKEGMASSIVCGIQAAANPEIGIMLLLGDMPSILTKTLTNLCHLFRQQEGKCIVAPVMNGRQGNPVIFPPVLRPQLLQLTGDRGPKLFLEKYKEMLVTLPVTDPGIFIDVDTQVDFGKSKGAETPMGNPRQ